MRGLDGMAGGGSEVPVKVEVQVEDARAKHGYDMKQ